MSYYRMTGYTLRAWTATWLIVRWSPLSAGEGIGGLKEDMFNKQSGAQSRSKCT